MAGNVSKVSSVASIVIGVVLLCFVVGVPDARADEQLIVRVPFAFTVGHAQFEPGSYIVRFDGDNPNVVEIVSADGSAATFTLTIPAAPERDEVQQPALVFTKDGGDYLLSRLITNDGNDDREIIKPRHSSGHPVTIAAR
jgi:hypothetical protein